MASPAKKLCEDHGSTVEGFVHGVGAVHLGKKTQSPYFNFTVQTSREEFHRGVSYSPEKRVAFEEVARQKSPVKLRHVRRNLNYSGDSYDVIVTRQSSMEPTEVSFTPKIPSGERALMLQDVSQLGGFKSVGEINVKIISMASSTSLVNVRGIDNELKECYVGDQTLKMKLILWEEQMKMAEMGQSYKITNIATRQHGGGVYLTCTKATTFQAISAVVVPDSMTNIDDPKEDLLTIMREIIAVSLKDRRICGQCGGRQSAFSAKENYHRCDTCHMLQRSSIYLANVTGTLLVSGDGHEHHRLTLTMSVLRRYLDDSMLTHLLTDVEDIELHLLNSGTLQLTYNQSNMLTEIMQVCIGQDPKVQGGSPHNSEKEEDMKMIDDVEQALLIMETSVNEPISPGALGVKNPIPSADLGGRRKKKEKV